MNQASRTANDHLTFAKSPVGEGSFRPVSTEWEDLPPVADYFSRYMEVQTLAITTSASVIHSLKAIFTRHGVPSVLVSDNGPQYNSTEMQEFAALYNFKHIASSPHYPQSKGLAARMVKTAKSLLSKSADPYLALLSYRATPLPWCGLSPAELLMGRRLQTDIPQPKRVFIPDWPYLTSFCVKDEEQKRQQNGSMTGVTESNHCHYFQMTS